MNTDELHLERAALAEPCARRHGVGSGSDIFLRERSNIGRPFGNTKRTDMYQYHQQFAMVHFTISFNIFRRAQHAGRRA